MGIVDETPDRSRKLTRRDVGQCHVLEHRSDRRTQRDPDIAKHRGCTFVVELVGPDRILFGSDFPFAPEPITKVSVRNLETMDLLDDPSRAAIDRTSALALFPRFG